MSEAVEFGDGAKNVADNVREEYSEYICPVDDDKRTKTVHFVSDTPDSVLEQAEAQAQETRAEGRQRSEMAGPLGEGVREQIKELGGFKGNNTTFSWRRAKGVYAEDGSTHRFGEDLSLLADYDDPVEGARAELKRKKEASAARGTSNLSGARDRGEEDIQEDQNIADAARTVQSEGCDHARDHCEHGDQEACEFLQEACGFDEEEVSQILVTTDGGTVEPESDVVSANPEPEPSDDNLVPAGVTDGAGTEDYDPDAVDTDTEQPAESDAIGGKAGGALNRSWSGYRTALSNVGDALDQLRESWMNAQMAARAINAIRTNHGQDPMHYEALEGANADVLDLLRKMARDCEECHADHSEHGHDTDAGPIEDVRQVVGEGADVTPVGLSEETAAAVVVAPDYHPEHFSGGERIEGRYEPDHGHSDTPDRDAATVPDAGAAETAPQPLAPADFETFDGETPGMRNRREGAESEFRERMDALAAQDAEQDPDTPDGTQTPPWDAGTIEDTTLADADAAAVVAETFDGWSEWADHVEGVLSNPGSELDSYGSSGRFHDATDRTGRVALSRTMTPTAARRVLLEAGREDAAEMYAETGELPGAESGMDPAEESQMQIGSALDRDPAGVDGTTDPEPIGNYSLDESGDGTIIWSGENGGVPPANIDRSGWETRVQAMNHPGSPHRWTVRVKYEDADSKEASVIQSYKRRTGENREKAIERAHKWMRENDADPRTVIETREQRDLAGNTDPQTRLAGGETGETETEIESTPAENAGGLMADTREDTGGRTPTGAGTEQATPDAFQVSDGGQQSLAEMGAGTEINDLPPAIEELEAAVDGYGDRIAMDNGLRDRLTDAGYPADAWTEQNSQDVFRYGIAAGEVRSRLPDDPETRAAIESILIDLANEQ